MARRRLSQDEIRLWREAMGERSDPAPAHGRRTPASRAPVSKPPVRKALRETETESFAQLLDAPGGHKKPAPRVRAAKKTAALPGELDPHDAKSIRRGRIEIDARIDLHGMTQTRAHETLVRFVQRSAAQHLRCVLVITGKGGRRSDEDDPYANFGAGVLRVQLPHWLEAPELASLVISSGPAAPQHGGDGARYVLLRRKRTRELTRTAS